MAGEAASKQRVSINNKTQAENCVIAHRLAACS